MSQDFGRRYRLLKTDEFSSVFALRRSQSHGFLQVFRSPNEAGHARLGLVVSKKVAKRAHERNYMKRVIRAWFRCCKDRLPEQDYVVRVRRAFTPDDFAAVCDDLQALLPEKRV